jgi:polyferredoxin
MIMRVLMLLIVAAGLGIASVLLIENLNPQHNVGALFGDLLVGTVVFLVTLLIGYFGFLRS